MKASNRLILSLTIGALVLQGCAESGGTRAETGQVASVAAQPVATSAPASKSTIAVIPEKDGKPVVTADTKDSFEAVAAAVRQQMQAGGRFAFVTKVGRETVDAKLTDMGALFEQYGTVNKMGPAAAERLLADQNSINEVLARYDSNRRICWQETPVGTHFPRMVCRTLGEIQNQQNQSKQSLEMMRQIQRQQSQISNSPASGGGH